MFLLSAQNNFYIEFIFRRACAKKINSEFHDFSWFPDHQNLDVCFFGKIFVELFWKSFSGRYSSLEPFVFLIFNSLPYVLKESRELRFD